MKTIPNDPKETVMTPDKSGWGMAGGKSDRNKGASGKKAFGKHDFRFWEGRLFKHTYLEGGRRIESKTFSVRIAHKGRRHNLPLLVSEIREAGKKARDLYQRIVTEGWDSVMAEMHPEPEPEAAPITLGGYIAAARTVAAVSPRSLEGYCRSLRRIVAGTLGVKGDKKRFGPKAGGSAAWRARIDGTPLADITGAKVNAWGMEYVREAGEDPAAAFRRKHSFNSLLRQAKGLFASELLERIAATMTLPDPLPLAGAKPYKMGTGSMRYRSRIQPAQLLAAAQAQLETDPSRREEWKVFLLAFLCGLRKAEIDTLTWEQIDFTSGVIHIERSSHFAPKTEESAADVDVDPELVEILRGLRAHATGEFFLESPLLPRPAAKFAYYRAEKTFESLNDWLADQGITARKKLHELRKEAGSLLAKESGLFAAQLFLRHSSPQTTAAHYLDKKQRLSTGLGALLRTGVQPENVTPIKATDDPELKANRAAR